MNIDKRLLKFMDQYFANRDCWINPEIKVCKNTGGYNFIPKDGIKGLVVFGETYPLSGQDLPIKDHLKVRDAIESVKPFGMVFENAKETELPIQDKQHFLYQDVNMKVFYWKGGRLFPI